MVAFTPFCGFCGGFFFNTHNSFILQAKLMSIVSKDSMLAVLSNDTLGIHCWLAQTTEVLITLKYS